MIILPAIDIKGGQCVRLYQGDYNQATIYDADPVQVAQNWQAAGASWLHIVDLDGAVAGQPINIEAIMRIRAITSLQIELGGGMRSLAHIKNMLNLGIERIILGTVALSDPALLKEALERWDERIAVGLDARNGRVSISGWRETSQVSVTELATELAARSSPIMEMNTISRPPVGADLSRPSPIYRPVGMVPSPDEIVKHHYRGSPKRFIYTDIARDGTMRGPNLDVLSELQRILTTAHVGTGNGVDGGGDLVPVLPEGATSPPSHSIKLIASGGVSSLDDLRSLAALGIEGAIIGKALYTGDVDLATAIREIER